MDEAPGLVVAAVFNDSIGLNYSLLFVRQVSLFPKDN